MVKVGEWVFYCASLLPPPYCGTIWEGMGAISPHPHPLSLLHPCKQVDRLVLPDFSAGRCSSAFVQPTFAWDGFTCPC